MRTDAEAVNCEGAGLVQREGKVEDDSIECLE